MDQAVRGVSTVFCALCVAGKLLAQMNMIGANGDSLAKHDWAVLAGRDVRLLLARTVGGVVSSG